MNQTQRKFLLDSIEAQFKRERDRHFKTKPVQPNLNNYLTAAILDGTFKLVDPDKFRKDIRERVIKLGQGKALLSHGPSDDSMWKKEESADVIRLPALALFESPSGYAEQVAIYETQMAEFNARTEILTAAFEAMKIKVQLGSDKALQALIDQADALCSMSITSASKLFITETPKPALPDVKS